MALVKENVEINIQDTTQDIYHKIMRTFTKTEHKDKLIHKLKGIIQQEIKPPDLIE